jgi:hypothetical protein
VQVLEFHPAGAVAASQRHGRHLMCVCKFLSFIHSLCGTQIVWQAEVVLGQDRLQASAAAGRKGAGRRKDFVRETSGFCLIELVAVITACIVLSFFYFRGAFFARVHERDKEGKGKQGMHVFDTFACVCVMCTSACVFAFFSVMTK